MPTACQPASRWCWSILVGLGDLELAWLEMGNRYITIMPEPQ